MGAMAFPTAEAMIGITIHFLDGRVLEWKLETIFDPEAINFREDCDKTVRIWLDHTRWIDMGNNEYRPISSVAKVTWKELATPPEKE